MEISGTHFGTEQCSSGDNGVLRAVLNYQRRALADKDIPVALEELFGSLAGMLTRDVFQVEINRRLGALLRVAGIEMQIVPHEDEISGEERARSDRLRLPTQFVDGDYDLLFTFGLGQLSKRSRQGVYETAVAVLTDYLRIASMSGPVVLRRFRYQPKQGESRLLSHTTASSSTESPAVPGVSQSKTTAYPGRITARFAHRLRNLLARIISEYSAGLLRPVAIRS